MIFGGVIAGSTALRGRGSGPGQRTRRHTPGILLSVAPSAERSRPRAAAGALAREQRRCPARSALLQTLAATTDKFNKMAALETLVAPKTVRNTSDAVNGGAAAVVQRGQPACKR